MKKRRSFKEIDRELEILRLERTIHKLKVRKSTTNLKQALTFNALVGTLVSRFFNSKSQ